MNNCKTYNIKKIYDLLLKEYGYQGWWPFISINGVNPTKTGSIKGYHPKDYSYPKTFEQQFEIAVGSILTQNTAWTNVEKVITNLGNENLLHPQKIISLEEERLKKFIKPAGFFNQKTMYLKNIAHFFININNNNPTRKELLKIKGIGNESCDTILLYAFKQPEFVIDTYTKRIMTELGYIKQTANYMEIKHLFENSLEKDFILYQEFHALLVEHAKMFYSKKPFGVNDPLKLLAVN